MLISWKITVYLTKIVTYMIIIQYNYASVSIILLTKLWVFDIDE